MKKYDLLKSGDSVVRVLEVREDMVLIFSFFIVLHLLRFILGLV